MKSNRKTVSVLGIPFQNLTRSEMEQRTTELLRTQNNAKIFTPNSEILYRTSRDNNLKRLLSSADLLLPDGVGVLLATRWKGTPLAERFPGIEMGEWLLRYAAKNGLSVFFLGGRPGVAEKAKKRLCAVMPNLSVCGTHHGYFEKATHSKENRTVVDTIGKAAPDLLFVCLGFPAQEQWIVENTPDLPSLRVSIGLGGALDVWSGSVKRAPIAFQACGMEWLWRAFQEPKRLFRLRLIPAFLWSVLRERHMTRK